MKLRIPGLGLPRPQVGGVARNLIVVGGATAVGQGALVLVSPVLSRLYDPEAFGLLSVYAAVLSVLVSIASLRFDFAIPIASEPAEAAHLLALSVVISLITSATLAVVLLLWGSQLAGALGAEPLVSFLWLLPIALFLASVVQALSSWAVYQRTFSALGRMRAIQGFAQAVGQASLGFGHAGLVGLILGDVAGRVFGAEQLIRSSFVRLRSTSLSVASMGRCARQRWGFARVMTGASFLSALSLQVPFLMIPALFDLQSSGQYFLAYRMLTLPASLVAAAVGQVFFGEASHRRADRQRLHDLALAAAVSLFVFSIPTYAIVAVGGQALIATVFGRQWQLAGLYAQIMAPSLIFWSIANPMSSLPVIGRRERESLAFTAAELGVKAASLGIGAALHSLTIGIVVLSLVSVAIEVAAMWRFLRIASVSLGELVRPAGRIAALTLPFLGLVLLVGFATPRFATPLLMPAVSAIAWVGAIAIAVRNSPEARALISGAHD